MVEINLTLNPGYRSIEKDLISELTPDGEFVMDHDMVIGFRVWSPTAESPANIDLLITMGGVFVTLVAHGVVKEISKDLYSWAKTKLKPVFNQKTAEGYKNGQRDAEAEIRVEMAFDDMKIRVWLNEPEHLEVLFLKLPDLVKSMRPEIKEEWEIDLSELE